MKICPRCNKTYTDANLNFCLDDGSMLTEVAGQALPETVMMNEPRITASAGQGTGQQTPQAGWNTAPQQPHSMQPKKSSKTWIWVVLILGVVVILCGGGFAGLVLISLNADKTATINSSGTPASNIKGAKSPSPSKSAPPTTTPATTTSSERTDVKKVDLSKWVQKFSVDVNTEFTDGDFVMSSRQKGYYYVLVDLTDTYLTESADAAVTLRNLDNASSRLGYGIVFHSNPTPLQQGYAFLIDTKLKRYRVVHHSPGKEDDVVKWTKADTIKAGAEDNTLEVRDLSDKVELYINGTMVTSIRNVYGYAGGVVGLYSGDAAKIAFRNMEIRK